MEISPMIHTQSLTRIYTDGAEVRALNDVNLDVPRGEFLAVTGPSGSGKSTLLNMIGALDRPTSGRVVVDGVEVNALKGNGLADFRRAKIGFVFQMFNLVPVLTALENVMLPLIPYRRRCEFDLEGRARELLEEIGLTERVHHLPSQLSGGEQQRVAIARALVNEPRLILADEPTGNVDSRTGAEIVALLRGLCEKRGVTVVLVTHDAAVTRAADRVVRLKDGRLV